MLHEAAIDQHAHQTIFSCEAHEPHVMDGAGSDTLEPNPTLPTFEDSDTPVLVELTRALARGANSQWWTVLGKVYRQSILQMALHS